MKRHARLNLKRLPKRLERLFRSLLKQKRKKMVRKTKKTKGKHRTLRMEATQMLTIGASPFKKLLLMFTCPMVQLARCSMSL